MVREVCHDDDKFVHYIQTQPFPLVEINRHCQDSTLRFLGTAEIMIQTVITQQFWNESSLRTYVLRLSMVPPQSTGSHIT